MVKSMFIHEFKMMVTSRKNILFLIALISLILTYCLLVLPTKETPDSFDPEIMKNEIVDLKAVQDGMILRGGTGFNRMAGYAPFADNVYNVKIQSRMVQAFEDKDFDRFLQFRLKGYGFQQMAIMRDWGMIGNAPYPMLDQGRDDSIRSLKYENYQEVGIPITYDMIEQKTALQTISNFLLGTTAFMVLFCAIYFSSDMLSKDRQHRTVLQGIPISWYRLINVKTFTTFIYTLIVLIGLLLLATIIISIQHGFGSFNLAVPITVPSTQPDDYWGYRFSEYDTISMAKFFLLIAGIVPILVYLFIRLNALISLLFKNSWIVLMVSTIILFSERIYYSRTKTELFGIDISNIPMTYFDFGRIVSGEKYYLLHLESITYGQGIIVLLCTVLALEVSIFIGSRLINKRRYFSKAA
ncbi:hypothetical protein [Ornithinibacillus halotolerans]|uniref:Uncharacterized protein n=1 Tax=Ornithinibacillus halotolerans TaxID=1274357 RepID=A0A916W824_9BACI|nr:hypothetical protein [Ornithinibacillus halotolerans]GGA74666.1 hypothetical protein GCM10008025_18020 [Ornithinibacillus halotolerans]